MMGSVEQNTDGMHLDDKALLAVRDGLGGALASAGSALSGMLNRQVSLREEGVEQGVFGALRVPELGESLAFQVTAGDDAEQKGLVLLPQDDMRQVLGILMGGDPAAMEGMPFDEMNMSAAMEVVGQALDAAAGALAAHMGRPVRFAVEQGVAVDSPAEFAALLPAGRPLLSLTGVQSIRDVLEGRLCCLIPAELGLALADSQSEPAPEMPAPSAPAPAPTPAEQNLAPVQAAPPAAQTAPDLDVRRPRFPQYTDQSSAVQALTSVNASLLMNVPLDVSIVIGKTKRRIRDILEFGPGTVIDLDKQTGAPAEIVVNGQLLAYGDVIVIGDNYGVRITEIVGTKDLLDSLNMSR